MNRIAGPEARPKNFLLSLPPQPRALPYVIVWHQATCTGAQQTYNGGLDGSRDAEEFSADQRTTRDCPSSGQSRQFWWVSGRFVQPVEKFRATVGVLGDPGTFDAVPSALGSICSVRGGRSGQRALMGRCPPPGFPLRHALLAAHFRPRPVSLKSSARRKTT